MGFAIVRLHWKPREFWQATPHELWSAIEVFDREAEAIEAARTGR